MSDDQIIRFPISHSQRLKNERGPSHVDCEIKDRWLQFTDEIEPNLKLIYVNVMTSENTENHKICELCLNIDDLQKAIDHARNQIESLLNSDQ